LLCIIQPARGLCSWADLLALTKQVVKRRSLEKMGIQMGKDAEGFLPTNMYTYAALIDQLERVRRFLMIKSVL
jgi:hypothetical protein